MTLSYVFILVHFADMHFHTHSYRDRHHDQRDKAFMSWDSQRG